MITMRLMITPTKILKLAVVNSEKIKIILEIYSFEFFQKVMFHVGNIG